VFIEAKDDGSGGDNWTTGAISRAKLQSNHHHQQTNIQFFYMFVFTWLSGNFSPVAQFRRLWWRDWRVKHNCRCEKLEKAKTRTVGQKYWAYWEAVDATRLQFAEKSRRGGKAGLTVIVYQLKYYWTLIISGVE